MSDQTARLNLPFLAPAQAQKHITVNEALLRLDALVQLSARSAGTTAQPASPEDGDIYLLPSGKTGAAWAAMANGALAYFRDGAWEQITPHPGWRCFIEDERALYAREDSAWTRIWATEERRLIFTPGGDGQISIYRIDAAREQNPRAATIASVSGDTITLTSSSAGLFFGAIMAGVSHIRIWNISKTPDESAWVKAAPSSNQIQVVSAGAIAGWSGGETIQIGDPTDVTPNRVIALDISPMMQSILGRIFRQSGVLTRVLASGVAASASMAISESGVTGSFNSTKSFQDGSAGVSQKIIPCSHPSPISTSNLVFVQESASGATMAIGGVSVLGVWS